MIMKQSGYFLKNVPVYCILFLFVALLPFQARPAEPTYPISTDVRTTRERTVRPVELPTDTTQITIDKVSQYATYGYSSWTFGAGVDAGPRLPDGPYNGVPTPRETLLTFFTISDIHIVDKESPGQAIYGAFGPEQDPPIGFGNTNTSAYSPIMMSTTHVLDAAVQTINVLHSRKPFDFGISLGDDANSTQYNELRWFIDVMDGKRITPSSGAHRGATFTDYQKPYQAAGLDKSIPWYQTIGNHDQFWCGSDLFNDYARNILLGKTILNIGLDWSVPPPPPWPTLDGRGFYMGVIDGKTEYGDPTGYGPVGNTVPPIMPTVAADRNRRSLSTATSTSLNWMKEFFKTTSTPKGHGFTQTNLDNDFASYSFEPRASVPLKVIVLDDTCKENPYSVYGTYARACLDQVRYDWLVNELDKGQAEGKLMIIAAHIPVGPLWNVPDAPPIPPNNYSNNMVVPLFLSTCLIKQDSPPNCEAIPPYTVVTDTSLLATLHNYSNLILWIAGHRHINTVTPQAALSGQGREFGFWEVETPSLRDHPQQFRTFEIVRNSDNTVSILVTDVDPAVQGESPAAKSRGYGIGAARISAGCPSKDECPAFTDTTSHSYNAELIKPLALPYTVTVAVNGTGTGAGTVISSPYSGIACDVDSSPCSATYLPGTKVALVATPAAGSAFAGWTPCAGTSTCTIVMNSDAMVTANFTQAPTLAITPTYKDFGTRRVGQKATVTFTVTNTTTKGIADLTITTLTMGGTDAGQFILVAGKDRCSGQTIQSGKTCTFQVSFKPTSANTKMATLTIHSNDPDEPEIIQVTGVGNPKGTLLSN
jgi:hypothetical protein